MRNWWNLLRKVMKFPLSQVCPSSQYSKGVTIICVQFPLAGKVNGILIKLSLTGQLNLVSFFWWFYFSLQIISHFTSCRKCWNVLPRGNHAIMWGLFCQHFSLSKNGFRSRVSWVADRWGNNIQKCQLQRRPTIQLL